MFCELLMSATLFDGREEREIAWREVRELPAAPDVRALAEEVFTRAKASFNIRLGSEDVRGRYVQDVRATLGTTSVHRFE